MYVRILILSCTLFALATLNAQTEWIGGSSENKFLDGVNWTNGVPVRGLQGTIGPGANVTVASYGLVEANIVQKGGLVEHPRGSMRASNWILEGGTWTVPDRYIITQDSTVVLNGGEMHCLGKLRVGLGRDPSYLRMSGGTFRVDENLDFRAGARLEISGGSAKVEGQVILFDDGPNELTITGGSFEGGHLVILDGTKMVIGANAEVTFGSRQVGGGGLGPDGAATLDFHGASPQARLTVKGGPLLSYESMWENDCLLFNGQSKSDLGGRSFHDSHFRVSGPNSETLSVVPEPAAAGWLAVACLSLALWRRSHHEQ